MTEIAPGPTPIQVCVESGILGNIERELMVTLDIIDGKASEYTHKQPAANFVDI